MSASREQKPRFARAEEKERKEDARCANETNQRLVISSTEVSWTRTWLQIVQTQV